MTTKKILFQIYSDIHIESWNKIPEIKVKSKYLILAGDICQLNHPLFYTFFDYCSAKWEKTFYVPGNHEYYSRKKNMNELEFEYKYRIGERYKNIFYLNNSFIPLNDDINIYGSTFWTNPPFNSNYEAMMYVNDYNYIKYFSQNLGYSVNLDINKARELCNDSFVKLNNYLKENKKKTIVITHFPPTRTGTSSPQYLAEEKTSNSYFSWPDDTLSKFQLNNVVAWISGHTHWSYDFQQNGVRLIGNQLGYKNEVGNTGMNEDGLYEITVS
jgi:predicted phosphodiesterase